MASQHISKRAQRDMLKPLPKQGKHATKEARPATNSDTYRGWLRKFNKEHYGVKS